MPNPFRNIPSVNQLLESPQLKQMMENVSHNVVVGRVREFLDDVRDRVNKASENVEIPKPHEMAERIADWLKSERVSRLQPVINGTGVILHTGLGRSPLSRAAMDRINAIGNGYASVEVDLATGQRSQRAKVVERLLTELTGAPAAAVANNNAAATMLALSAMARGREVIVSRGQLVEIGGSYRLPEVMEAAGCVLREVGTTNKVRLADYENAINENTGAILRVHPSNFQVVGFTESVELKELIGLAHRHDLPLIDDVGSGALVDFQKYGLTDEPVVRESIDCGADLVLFSGDKLVGGPQAGILVGKTTAIERVLREPLMRAMRVDKITLAALEATLELYHNVETAEQEIPILRMLSMPADNLKFRAEKFVGQLAGNGAIETAEVIEESSMLGGGSLPTQTIPTWCVSLKFKDVSVDHVAKQLRGHRPSIFGRINKERLLIDFRTVFPAQDIQLMEGMLAALK
ncbi:MAG: L-seryl-tRNA(Sec) selenium transferase [Pirellulaceae bacterium]